jgi:hypothetical protein
MYCPYTVILQRDVTVHHRTDGFYNENIYVSIEPLFYAIHLFRHFENTHFDMNVSKSTIQDRYKLI